MNLLRAAIGPVNHCVSFMFPELHDFAQLFLEHFVDESLGAEEDKVYGTANIDQDSRHLEVGYVERYNQGVIVRPSEAERFPFFEGDNRAFKHLAFRARFPDLPLVLLDQVQRGAEELGSSHDHVDPFLGGLFASVIDLDSFGWCNASFDGVFVFLGLGDGFEIEVGEITS
ncbi:unnamed protein product [Cochlearia groenlandica]